MIQNTETAKAKLSITPVFHEFDDISCRMLYHFQEVGLRHLARPRSNSDAKTVTSKRLIHNAVFYHVMQVEIQRMFPCTAREDSSPHCSSSSRPAVRWNI